MALFNAVCVEGDCQDGETAVAQLQTFYAQAGSPAQFSDAVQSIVNAYNDAEGSWSRHLPFSPECCNIKTIGRQAADLMGKIGSATGNAAPPLAPTLTDPNFKPPGTDLGKYLTYAVIAAVILGALYFFGPQIKKAIGSAR